MQRPSNEPAASAVATNYYPPDVTRKRTPNISVWPQSEQERQCTYQRNIERRSRNLLLWKAKSITHVECVCVALGTQHEKRMRRILLPSVTCVVVPQLAT